MTSSSLDTGLPSSRTCPVPPAVKSLESYASKTGFNLYAGELGAAAVRPSSIVTEMRALGLISERQFEETKACRAADLHSWLESSIKLVADKTTELTQLGASSRVIPSELAKKIAAEPNLETRWTLLEPYVSKITSAYPDRYPNPGHARRDYYVDEAVRLGVIEAKAAAPYKQAEDGHSGLVPLVREAWNIESTLQKAVAYGFVDEATAGRIQALPFAERRTAASQYGTKVAYHEQVIKGALPRWNMHDETERNLLLSAEKKGLLDEEYRRFSQEYEKASNVKDIIEPGLVLGVINRHEFTFIREQFPLDQRLSTAKQFEGLVATAKSLDDNITKATQEGKLSAADALNFRRNMRELRTQLDIEQRQTSLSFLVAEFEAKICSADGLPRVPAAR